MTFVMQMTSSSESSLWHDQAGKTMNKTSKSEAKNLAISLIPPKKKRTTAIKCGKNTVIYPIIYEASKLMQDDFWKGLLEELSIGKYPKSIYISNSILFSANKRKPFSYSLNPEDKTAQEVAEELHSLLLSHTNLCSDTDTTNRKALVQSKNNQGTVTKWSSIKKKNLRDQHILNYTQKMRKKYKLSYQLTRHLLATIHNAFDFKTHCSNDVEFKDDEIKSIADIVYDETYNTFINLRQFDPEYDWVDDTGLKEKNYLHYYWGKYILTMAKPV